jgi:hypothetical protein
MPQTRIPGFFTTAGTMVDGMPSLDVHGLDWLLSAASENGKRSGKWSAAPLHFWMRLGESSPIPTECLACFGTLATACRTAILGEIPDMLILKRFALFILTALAEMQRAVCKQLMEVPMSQSHWGGFGK